MCADVNNEKTYVWVILNSRTQKEVRIQELILLI